MRAEAPQGVTAELRQGPYRVRLRVQGGALRQVDLLPLKKRGPRPRSRTALSGPDERLMQRALKQLREYFSGRKAKLDLPLAQEGTPFQQAVWQALRRVPAGRTLSYGQLAARAGRPKAARAVGSAMARNRLPLFVPCHRVLAAGGLGGFSGGPGWKKALLELEGVRL